LRYNGRLHKITEGIITGKPTRGRRIQICYMIWQMMIMKMQMMHSNGQLRTEKDGDIGEGCQKPAPQQKTTDDWLILLSMKKKVSASLDDGSHKPKSTTTKHN